MSKLKIPSLQHMARNWYESPKEIENALIDVVRSTPPFNYNMLNTLTFEHLNLRTPKTLLQDSVRLKEKRVNVQRNFIEVLAHFCKYFEDVRPDYVHQISTRYYPLHRDLKIEFKPPLLYGIGGQVYFPWFSFWKNKPLRGEQLSLFVTVVYELLHQDPDLENAKFQILDFSANSPRECRSLKVINASEVERVSEHRKNEMLAIFWEGYQQAEATLASERKSDVETQIDTVVDKNQLRLI
jgi:hypothetical protein